MRHKALITTTIASLLLLAGTAVAGVHQGQPVPVPEPGIFPLLAMGAAVTIIAYRIRKKK